MTERQLFGTDGVRGVANEDPMTAEMALELGRALGYTLKRDNERRHRVLVGKDTRLSGYLFETAIASGLVSAGVDVLLVGPLPTPGIAFLTESMRCDAGVVISASHNPYQDNGIKLFGHDGYKLPDEDELALEQLMGSDELAKYRPTGTTIGRASRIEGALGRYAVFAKSAFPRRHTLDGVKVVVDCAHGAGYRVAPVCLKELGAEVIALGVEPSGTNINERCGALHPESLSEAVQAHGAHYGLALDGDADRCILCDENGKVVDGDQILALLGRYMLANDALPNKTLVATVMSNLGLDRAIREGGGSVVRVGVGDRYVVERMRADGLLLGGEQSGHIILREHGTTGDGLVTGLSVLGVMVQTGQPLSALAGCMQRFPQVLTNVPVKRKPKLETLDAVQARIADVERILGEEGRVLVRYSGTQMLLRVMVEGPDPHQIQTSADSIAASIVSCLGD